jgi:transcription elongation factor Elf1
LTPIGKTLHEMKSHVSKFFPWCPFCCFEDLEIVIEPEEGPSYILCDNCRAKWEMNIQEKIKSVRLVSTGILWKGRDLLEKEMEPQFWQNKAWLCILTRKTPKKKLGEYLEGEKKA